MPTISIVDLEVHYRVGVPDEERATPQRLLITVNMEFDFTAAAKSDSVEDTINYYSISQELRKFGDGRSWKLLERLVTEIADRILLQFRPAAVYVEVKKFIIPETRYVSVSLTRRQN